MCVRLNQCVIRCINALLNSLTLIAEIKKKAEKLQSAEKTHTRVETAVSVVCVCVRE